MILKIKCENQKADILTKALQDELFFSIREVAIQLVSLQMRGREAINDIFSLKWRYYGLKGDILDYRGTLIYFLLYYSVLSKDKCL